MTNKQLAWIALIGAPAMFIGVSAEFLNENLQQSAFTGIWGIIYITAWMCSLYVMYQRRVAGNGFGKWLIRVMFVTLTLADISNVIQIITPHNVPWFFMYLDFFWPFSHLLMLVLGITVLFNKRLDITSKIILAAAGFWLPIALIPMLIFGKTESVVFYPGVYNALMWALMAYVALKSSNIQPDYARTQE